MFVKLDGEFSCGFFFFPFKTEKLEMGKITIQEIYCCFRMFTVFWFVKPSSFEIGGKIFFFFKDFFFFLGGNTFFSWKRKFSKIEKFFLGEFFCKENWVKTQFRRKKKLFFLGQKLFFQGGTNNILSTSEFHMIKRCFGLFIFFQWNWAFFFFFFQEKKKINIFRKNL